MFSFTFKTRFCYLYFFRKFNVFIWFKKFIILKKWRSDVFFFFKKYVYLIEKKLG